MISSSSETGESSPSTIPRWIERMYSSTKGRDHLGLGSVSSDQILPTLSPGINVLTYHPRYHGFYVFLLDEFWRRDRPRSHKSWVAFFRAREFIFSVGCHLCDRPEHANLGNIVGSQRTGPLAREQLDHYDTQTHYIKSDLGGYGLYYRSVMIELGLVYPGGPGFPYRVDIPTEKGKDLAEAFRRAVRTTEYYTSYFEEDSTQVPFGVVHDFIRKACLCQLQRADAPDRDLIREEYLHQGQAPQARRATFRLFLDVAEKTDGEELDQAAFRRLLFFRESSEGNMYKPRKELRDTFLRWRLYQAREYYAFALNALWYYLCEWGLANHGDARPIPISQVWAHFEGALEFDRLAGILRIPRPRITPGSGFQQLLHWLTRTAGATEENFDETSGLRSPLQEDRLYALALERKQDPAVMVAGMVAMLGLCLLRFGHAELWMRPEWAVARMGADGRLSMDGFLRQARRRLQSGPITLAELAKWLLNDYVILQHQLVATTKLPENTYRFQREGDRLRFYNLENPLTFTDSRFDALSTTIHELGFCGDLREANHGLTQHGKRLLTTGEL